MSTAVTPQKTRAPSEKRSPWSELETFEERIDRMLGRLPTMLATHEPLAWLPSVDLKETDEAFTLTAELPGMDDKDVVVSVENGVLTFKGEKKSERTEESKDKSAKKGRWHLYERSYGAFERAFTLPDNVDEAKIVAEFKAGVLTVKIPKTKPATARAIPVNGAK